MCAVARERKDLAGGVVISWDAEFAASAKTIFHRHLTSSEWFKTSVDLHCVFASRRTEVIDLNLDSVSVHLEEQVSTGPVVLLKPSFSNG